MSLQSKFSGQCKFCNISWNVGDLVYKNPGWKNWCSNKDCKQDLEEKGQNPWDSNTIPSYQKVHDEVWEFALSKAEKIYPNKHDTTQKMILAQVFYKKCFDCKIHGVKA